MGLIENLPMGPKFGVGAMGSKGYFSDGAKKNKDKNSELRVHIPHVSVIL